MLWATNEAIQSLGEESLVSFDTIICNTNENATVDDDQILITQPGWYEISIRGVFVNASTSTAIQVGLQLLANDEPVQGSQMIWKVPTQGKTPAYLSVPVHVLPAASGNVATFSWQVTDQTNLHDVMLTVERKI